ncbi:RFX DNA-binding domain-containing protein [Xylariaceae sp. FL0016]|nr:RFX DNA-binding domain-containing protein [Xylariaceae sp. FL0016]
METDPQPPEAGAMSHHHQRKRTQSRASTASIHSISTQPTLEQSLAVAHNGHFTDQWTPNEHGAVPQPRAMSVGPQMASQMHSGEMILRPGSQMQQHNHSFPVGAVVPFHAPQHGLPSNLPTETYGGAGSFGEDSQMDDRDDIENGDAMSATVAAPAPKASSGRTSANNELEMRQLFYGNRHRKLQDVARELHGNERGPNSERTRQVFAMLWINGVCTKGKGSVPRGRVYANYASRCATERITVLNPASFGKLVRVLFPGLKTRRLGVRGESKYHYVNFSLTDDQPELREPVIQPALPMPDPPSFNQTFTTTHSQSPAMDQERPSLPSPHFRQSTEAPVALRRPVNRTHSLYNQPDVMNIEQFQSATSKTMLRLSFATDVDASFDQSKPLVLPSIEPFLPPGTDPDSAKSLTALYRSHCTSLVECIRYCREKTFFHLFTSFQGTLTMPVQKLFSNPALAQWIEEADFVLYQRMMRIISALTLQVVPKPVLDTLRSISERLVSHIRESFQGQPRHVIQAKEAPATIFAGLLDRTLRVNLTAHAAANMLSNPANRDQMYLDWITMVRIRKIAECVPTKAMDDLSHLLLNELRKLLNPVDVPWELECMTLYGDIAIRDGRGPQDSGADDAVNAQNMLDRWVTLLRSLPTLFPYAKPADIVWGVQRVGTEVMRDITIAQGKSFGSWWVTKCWIDEMVSFIAEQGGFMQTRSSAAVPTSSQLSSPAMKNASQTGRPLSTGNDDPNASQVTQSQPDRAPFSSRMDGQDLLHSANPDDSGIGIRTPEEELPVGKFGFQQAQPQGLQSPDLDHVIS